MSTELTTPDLCAPMSETLSLQIAPLGWCWSSHVSSPDHCLKTFTNVAFSSIQHVACYTHLLCVYYSCAFQFYTKFTLISWMLFDWVNELKDVTVDLINNRFNSFSSLTRFFLKNVCQGPHSKWFRSAMVSFETGYGGSS